MIRIVSVSGYKNSGKSTLCRALLTELLTLGVRTGYIKRSDESIALSPPNTDTGAAAECGVETLLWGADGLRMESKAVTATPSSIAARYFPDAELLILEGGKSLSLPKIWVLSKGDAVPDYPGIFMVYDRYSPKGDNKRFFVAGEERLMATRLLSLVRGSAYRSSRIYIGDRPLPMKDFIADFVRGSVLGMLASLKGGDNPDAPIRIYLDDVRKK